VRAAKENHLVNVALANPPAFVKVAEHAVAGPGTELVCLAGVKENLLHSSADRTCLGLLRLVACTRLFGKESSQRGPEPLIWLTACPTTELVVDVLRFVFTQHSQRVVLVSVEQDHVL